MHIRDHRRKRVKANSIFGLKPILPRETRREIHADAVRDMPPVVRICRRLVVILFFGRLDLPRYFVPAILRRGFCPSCGYPLGERLENDGCRVCSECGGAWRP